jgi:hypothetical protein
MCGDGEPRGAHLDWDLELRKIRLLFLCTDLVKLGHQLSNWHLTDGLEMHRVYAE